MVDFGLTMEKWEKSRGKKSVFFSFPSEGKSRSTTENFPQREKVGLLPRFSLGREKHLYISYISGKFPFPQGQGKEVWRLEAAAAHNFFPSLTRAILKSQKGGNTNDN